MVASNTSIVTERHRRPLFLNKYYVRLNHFCAASGSYETVDTSAGGGSAVATTYAFVAIYDGNHWVLNEVALSGGSTSEVDPDNVMCPSTTFCTVGGY